MPIVNNTNYTYNGYIVYLDSPIAFNSSSPNYSGSINVNIDSVNPLIITYTINNPNNIDLTNKYIWFRITNFADSISNVNSLLAQQLTPYIYKSNLEKKSYFELWQQLYGNETFKNYLLSLDNDQIEIILNDIYDHLDQSQVESLLSDIYDKLDESTSIVSTDTDINIEVDLDLDTGSGITSVVNKLKQLYNTGINITSFVTALNFFDNLGWFTDLQDRDLVNSVNSSYIDLYD